MTFVPAHSEFLSAPSTSMPIASELLMRRSSQKVGLQSIPDATLVGERTCNFVRERYASAPAYNVAADLKGWWIKAATITKMLERRSPPGWYTLLAMICVYGPEFLCAILPSPPAWLVAAYRAQQQAKLEAIIADANAKLEALP